MSILHQKGFMDLNFPFRLWVDDDLEFGAHWHQELEIVYAMKGTVHIGINNEVYILNEGDILLINGGTVHYFLHSKQPNKEIIIQCGLSLLDAYSDIISENRFVNPLIKRSADNELSRCVHGQIEKQILLLAEEYNQKQVGYHMAVKARLYDLMVLLLRYVPMERYSLEEKSKQLMQLEVLKRVFKYVEENYKSEITLDDVSEVANYNVYYFTRFFKNATGMTFGHYLRDFRVRKAEALLKESDDSITDVAFQCGFNSIKTFNRIFKQIRGCSPTEYKKAISEK